MNKKHKQIFADTLARWRETILNPNRGDVDTAKKLIQKVYRGSNVFVVDTPAQFYVAQAVIRKRITKTYARDVVCPAFNIKPDFIADLRGHGGPIEQVAGQQWSRRGQDTIFDRTWFRYMNTLCHGHVYTPNEPGTERSLIHGPSRWTRSRNQNTNLNNFLLYQTCDLQALHWEFVRPAVSRSSSLGTAAEALAATISGALGFSSTRNISNACLTLADAISREGADIAEDRYTFQSHMYDATNSELMCKIINCKDQHITFFHEIFHLVPAIMRFKGAFLVLAEKPKIARNASGMLHSETGQAVEYSDGLGFWFFDGHILREQGPKIILEPDKLTTDEIDGISNEEERRIAIDRTGWEKYLVGMGADVLDTRENWVDNTTEVLFKIKPKTPRREEPLRALLACRSTGRRYFLAIPQQTENMYWKRERSQPIKTCEDVQKWMANGAMTEFLPYAKHSVRVVGAS